MMQQGYPAASDVALADDSQGSSAWHGRRMAKGPFFSKAAVWHAWNSRSLYPTFDIGEEIREMDERRGRGWRMLAYVAFLCLLAAGATWTIWSGH